MSSTRVPELECPLFHLPRELRDLIYEQVFADLISNPFVHPRVLRESAMESLLKPTRTRSGITLDIQGYLLGMQELPVQFVQSASNRD